ncbi:MAG: response regulator, partial [Bacteroidales bacterium]
IAKGTNISVELPYIPATHEPLKSFGEPEAHIPHPLKILVVEDDDYHYLLVEEILSAMGYICIRASHATEALEMFQMHKPFHLILLDLRIPGKGGFEIAVDIRRFDKQVPIVAVTAFAQYLNRSMKELQEFDAIITKPINTVNLLHTIKKVLNATAH